LFNIIEKSTGSFTQYMNERILVNPITKEKIQVLATAAETNGAYTMDEGIMLPQGSTNLHYHRIITQRFTALEGPLHIHLGGKEIVRLQENESYTIKPGIVHSLFNPTSSPIHYRVVITPGHEGFERMMRILYGMADQNKVSAYGIPHDYATTALLMDMGDTFFINTHTILYPWLKWKANQARKKGIEQLLNTTYCTAW
jgi:mannose-6-phosphate isomerase-like protein (cupin superfamily)